MKCPKCGVKLTAHVKFCSSCGERIERFKEIPNATEKEFVAVRMKKSFLSFWHKQDLFCKIETVAITAASLLLVVAFFSKKVLPIVFSILQLGGLIAALLMHKKKIKCTRDWLQFLVLIIAIAVTVPNISSYSWFEKTGAGAQNSEKHTKVETPCSAVDCIGKDKEAIRADFIVAGFVNISEEAIEDLESTDKNKYGKIEMVSINGVTDFEGNQEFTKSSKVIIKYHSYKRINTPLSSEEVKTMEVDAIIKAFQDAGFIQITTEEKYDLDPDTTTVDSENQVYIGNEAVFEKDRKFPLNSSVKIVIHKPYEKYDLKVIVDFVPNLFLNQYDVKFEIDGKTESLTHGKDAEFECRMKQGKYTLTFTSMESSSVKGSVVIDFTGNTEASYKISCYSDKISIETKYVAMVGKNEAMVPTSASNCEYKNYEDVENTFKKAGFSNIKTQILYDIVWGITSEGEVEKVSINGKTDFKKGDVYPTDAVVVITYHMKKEDDPNNKNETSSNTSNPNDMQESKPNLTVENNVDFASLMKITDQTDVVTIKAFVNLHKGDTIEFDGCIALMMKHENYKTRFDVCMVGGNYNANRVYGPLFAFENVNYYDMNVSGSDTVAQGMNFRITAKVIGFSEAGRYIILDPVALKTR